MAKKGKPPIEVFGYGDGKRQTSIRLSRTAKALVEEKSKALGVTQTAVWEMAIRHYCSRQTFS